MEALHAQLIVDEGLRLKPYHDSVGKLTIGIGRNLDDKGISHNEAIALLDNDIAEHLMLLDRELPWWRRLDDARQLVLANMAFNLGVGPTPEQPNGKLLQFKNTLDHMARGEYDAAADGMAASAWAKQVGERAVRLVTVMRAGAAPS